MVFQHLMKNHLTHLKHKLTSKTMKKILILLIIALTYSALSFAQTKEPLVIDGETCIKTNKTSFTLSTISEQLKNKILAKYPDIKQYTVEIKKDRLGVYYNYVIRFKLDKHQEVSSWLKSL